MNKTDGNTNNKDIIAGRNPVTEALRSGRPIDCLYIAKGELSGSVKVIAALAREKHIPIKEVDRKKLDYMTAHSAHQGVAASASLKEYASVDDIFELAASRNEKPFIIVLDEIEDPHNLGAIIRTAECAGAHGIIIPKRRSAGLSFTVGKASAGAYEYVPVARVTNIAAALDELKERGCSDCPATGSFHRKKSALPKKKTQLLLWNFPRRFPERGWFRTLFRSGCPEQ